MRHLRAFLTVTLLSVALPVLASGCASTDTLSFPPSADLQRLPKPQLDPEQITSEAHLDWYDTEIEFWGRDADAKLGRLCEFFKAKGMKIKC